ncbi:conserved hypothetical protein [Talaromyces stipitatus ATCC 10500]|uniref:N-acetyltransferase domain-containing protein n=1 Tax=Talaromyces stipitatus (strain ATCC 10500 / CBS 375.48 / QM 6759 / NRRL 1006) TaxID=441959 RepID=B8MD99_TALSN|nr:uncharacterized protein TSTA_114370 [Talaromyces stipitatus ATCC 10500]EED17624.1 conserved hypothetical protein [Talaromyces stipitatus ATCC 10500]
MSNDWSPSPTFSIPTERLHISYFQADNSEHTEFLVRLWNTEDFIKSCGKTGLDTPEKSNVFIRNRVLQDYKRNKHGQFLVHLAESRLIGVTSLMKGEPPNAYSAPDIGYTILPEESGKGYATEASIGLLEYARRELGINDAFGFCGQDDARCRRVLEKIGLQFRGNRALKVFGGAQSAVYALPEMSQDLTVYGIDD